jgi:hypothetical protein
MLSASKCGAKLVFDYLITFVRQKRNFELCIVKRGPENEKKKRIKRIYRYEDRRFGAKDSWL